MIIIIYNYAMEGGKSMFKTEFIRRVAKETRLSQRVVADVLGASHSVIQQVLSQGQEVKLPGFGTFYTRERPEGRLQQFGTKKMVRVPAVRVAAFRVGDVLKRGVRKAKRRGLFRI
jgi:DNA-binding protein HU-beta